LKRVTPSFYRSGEIEDEDRPDDTASGGIGTEDEVDAARSESHDESDDIVFEVQ
jgi:hypothetical protein